MIEAKVTNMYHFSRPRFVIKTKNSESAPFMSFEFAYQLFQDLIVSGKYASVLFILLDGTKEEVTEFFI